MRPSASEVMGQTAAASWALKEKWPIDSLKPTFRLLLWNSCDLIMESGRMNTTTQHRCRLGAFPVPHGYVDSKVFPSSDQWMQATLGPGKVELCQILFQFVCVAEEGTDAGFDVRGQDVHLNSQVKDGSEDLGELLPASTTLGQRAEVVLETTVDVRT